jgi:protein-L-isoaspartate O-methyltransferase
MEPIGYVTRLLAQGGKNGKTQISSSDRAKQLADQARALEHEAGIRRSDDAF